MLAIYFEMAPIADVLETNVYTDLNRWKMNVKRCSLFPIASAGSNVNPFPVVAKSAINASISKIGPTYTYDYAAIGRQNTSQMQVT